MSREPDAIVVGDELPPLRRIVTRDDVRAYAEIGGDRNPLHLDDEVARASGFDGVIAHGMFTMAHMASCVTAWAGPGAVVERISAQFRASVSMGDELVASGRVRAVDDPAGTVTVEAWVDVVRVGASTLDRDRPIKQGEVVLRL